MMDDFFDLGTLQDWLAALREWVLATVLSADSLGQFPIVAAAFILAHFAARPLRPWAQAQLAAGRLSPPAQRAARAAADLAFPSIALILMWFSAGLAAQLEWSQGVVRVVASLLTAWVIIRLLSNLMGDTVWTRFLALAVWTVAALSILNLLGPTIDFLDGIAVTLGALRISTLTVIKGIAVLALLLWLAVVVSRALERRIYTAPSLTPSLQVLLTKLLKIALVVTAVVVALNSIGIDLTGLAIFGGAVGVGVGFGLQKIVSNLISGVILLLDKSIKPGDVIEVTGTYGWINSLGARYVSIVTRDGTEHLIPNEDLVTHPVINWSHTNNLVRLHLPIGISYHSDVREAIEQILAAANENERVLKDPAPRCFITGFGDSSVELELRFWINDPQNGTANAKGSLFLAVWDRFHEHGVEVPFPQRDLHLRSGVPMELRVRMEGMPLPGAKAL